MLKSDLHFLGSAYHFSGLCPCLGTIRMHQYELHWYLIFSTHSRMGNERRRVRSVLFARQARGIISQVALLGRGRHIQHRKSDLHFLGDVFTFSALMRVPLCHTDLDWLRMFVPNPLGQTAGILTIHCRTVWPLFFLFLNEDSLFYARLCLLNLHFRFTDLLLWKTLLLLPFWLYRFSYFLRVKDEP